MLRTLCYIFLLITLVAHKVPHSSAKRILKQSLLVTKKEKKKIRMIWRTLATNNKYLNFYIK